MKKDKYDGLEGGVGNTVPREVRSNGCNLVLELVLVYVVHGKSAARFSDQCMTRFVWTTCTVKQAGSAVRGTDP